MEKRVYYTIDRFGRTADEIAAERKCVAVRPGKREAQLDLDTIEDYARFKDALAINLFNAKVARWWRSSSGQGYHIVLEFDFDLDDTTRIALQAIYGSDLRREAINLARIRFGIRDPNVLLLPAKAKLETDPGRLP